MPMTTTYGGPNGISWLKKYVKGFAAMYDQVQKTKQDEARYKSGDIQPRKDV